MVGRLNEIDENLSTRIQAKRFCGELKKEIVEATGSIGNPSHENTVNYFVDTLVFSAVRAIATGTPCWIWASEEDVTMTLISLGSPTLDFEGFYECVSQNCRTEIKAYKKSLGVK